MRTVNLFYWALCTNSVRHGPTDLTEMQLDMLFLVESELFLYFTFFSLGVFQKH